MLERREVQAADFYPCQRFMVLEVKAVAIFSFTCNNTPTIAHRRQYLGSLFEYVLELTFSCVISRYRSKTSPSIVRLVSFFGRYA